MQYIIRAVQLTLHFPAWRGALDSEIRHEKIRTSFFNRHAANGLSAWTKKSEICLKLIRLVTREYPSGTMHGHGNKVTWDYFLTLICDMSALIKGT